MPSAIFNMIGLSLHGKLIDLTVARDSQDVLEAADQEVDHRIIHTTEGDPGEEPKPSPSRRQGRKASRKKKEE